MLKMSRWAIAVQVITISLVTQSQAHALTWFSFNGHEYALTSQWQSWDENEAEAVMHGGTLAVWTSPGTADTPWPHNEAHSNASGLMPPR